MKKLIQLKNCLFSSKWQKKLIVKALIGEYRHAKGHMSLTTNAVHLWHLLSIWGVNHSLKMISLNCRDNEEVLNLVINSWLKIIGYDKSKLVLNPACLKMLKGTYKHQKYVSIYLITLTTFFPLWETKNAYQFNFLRSLSKNIN